MDPGSDERTRTMRASRVGTNPQGPASPVQKTCVRHDSMTKAREDVARQSPGTGGGACGIRWRAEAGPASARRALCGRLTRSGDGIGMLNYAV